MAEEAGKILELLSIENVGDAYRLICEMQPIELVRHLENEKISTRGHMPELRARLLRCQVRKCHPHVHVPWYPEDEEEKEDNAEEVVIVEEIPSMKSLAKKVDFLQREMEKFKIQHEKEKRDDAETESGESTEKEEDNTTTSSDGEKSEVEVQVDFEPIDLTADSYDDAEYPDLLDADELAEITEKSNVPDVNENVDKADNSIQYDWIEKESEKIVESHFSYNVPTPQDHAMKQKTPPSQPTWIRCKINQSNAVDQPIYEYYRNSELMMNAQPDYGTDYPNYYYMPPNIKPYWL